MLFVDPSPSHVGNNIREECLTFTFLNLEIYKPHKNVKNIPYLQLDCEWMKKGGGKVMNMTSLFKCDRNSLQIKVELNKYNEQGEGVRRGDREREEKGIERWEEKEEEE